MTTRPRLCIAAPAAASVGWLPAEKCPGPFSTTTHLAIGAGALIGGIGLHLALGKIAGFLIGIPVGAIGGFLALGWWKGDVCP